jgi:serine/threonine-protein kinase
MIRLRILGGVDLRNPDGATIDAVLAQPRRMALLAYLALTEPGRPRRRDTLLGVLWPERDAESARAALNKAVHFLRKALGTEAIVTRGAEDVAINPAAVWCDAVAFREAASDERFDDALAAWGGDLLPGFFIEEAQPFDEWLEGERRTLRTRAAEVARRVAETRAHAGEVTGSVNAARQAVELAGHDERVVRELIELLDRLGDRAGALQAYDRFAARLREEFDAEPAAETRALVAGVRARDDVRVPVARPRNGGGVESGTLEAALRAGLDERFDIARELSGGNMARVFVATERALQRQVVLKVLLPEHGEGVSVERFRREIQVAARLAHPNLVPVLTAGEMAGHPFYVMPLVAGASLRDRLTGGPLPLLEARAILRDVADALAYAHDRGIVHRDIKPGNVLLVGARALVTDFGIAKAIADARMGAVGAPLTHTGSSLGTPTYMAPEQAAADPATDHRADVYSFGVMAWEMLVGHPPFHGLAPQALLAAHMSTVPPDVRASRPEVPRALAALVMQCLEKDPVARPQRMAEVVRRLDAAVASGVVEESQGIQRKRWWPAIAAAAVLAVAAGALLMQDRAPPVNPELVIVAPWSAAGSGTVDSIGLEIADRMTQALAQEGVATVVPALRMRELVAGLDRRSPEFGRRLARAAGAGVLVSGTIGGSPGRVELRTELLRMPQGRSVVVLDPVVGASALEAADSLRERLQVAVAAHHDWGDNHGWGRDHRLPQNLAAYRAAVAADETRDRAEITRHWKAALAADSMWPRAIIANGDFSLEGSERGRRLSATWPAGDRDALTIRSAEVNGEWEAAYVAVQRRLSVDSVTWVQAGVIAANNMQRHEEGARIGARRNLPSYWSDPARRQPLTRIWTAHVLHALGRYDEELAMADELAEVAPELKLNQVNMRIAASAGLGKVAELERLLDESIGLMNRPGEGVASASRAFLVAGELRAHGRPADAVRLARRGLPWFERQASERTLTDNELDGYIDLLALAEQWEELVRQCEVMVARFPRGDASAYAVSASSQAAVGYSRLGVHDKAQASVARIDRMTVPDSTVRAMVKARALFEMGEHERAMDAFRLAYTNGYWVVRSFNTRHRMFVRAEQYAPFRALVAPR